MLLQNILCFAQYHYGHIGWIALDAETEEVYWFRYKPEYDENMGYWIDDSSKTEAEDLKLINMQGKSNLPFHEAIYKL